MALKYYVLMFRTYVLTILELESKEKGIGDTNLNLKLYKFSV